MRALGFDRFAVVGHDRGGRCAYRMALDHPERVAALSVLDILPTPSISRAPTWRSPWATGTGSSSRRPTRLPETLIGADPDAFYLRRGRDLFDPGGPRGVPALLHDPATIHAMCEDYRAGAGSHAILDACDALGDSDLAAGIALTRAGAVGRERTIARWHDMRGVSARWARCTSKGRASTAAIYLGREAPA